MSSLTNGRFLLSALVVFALVIIAAMDSSIGGTPADAKTDSKPADVDIARGHNVLRQTDVSSISPDDSLQNVRFNDVDGKQIYLADLTAKGPVVLVFTSTACPLAKRYTQRLIRLHNEFASKGVTLIGVYSNAEDTYESIAENVKQLKFPFTIVKDVFGQLARTFDARMTPQVFVVDRSGRLVYTGAIDDNRIETRVKHHYLRDTLSALLAGKSVPTASNRSLGCTIHLRNIDDIEKVTYTTHVARILQDNCQTCHREDEVAPFTITNYEEAKTWATEIKSYSKSRLMPPWKAAPGFGKFQHDRSLSEDEITLLARWVDSDTPQGDPRDLAPSPRYSKGWALGEPDLIIEMPEEYVVGPEGEDDYRHFIIPTDFDSDMYVSAVDVQPGNRQTVHHVIVYTDTSGKARELDAADPGPGYTFFGSTGFKPSSSLGGWAPGTMPDVLPNHTGKFLPKGCDVVLQVHYYRTGVEERDRTRVGLYFSRSRKPARVWNAIAINKDIVLEPRLKRQKFNAYWDVKNDVYALSVYPHMHLLGTEMKVEAELADGTVVPMIWIKHWDFNWQGGYSFERPMLLPRGSRVKVTAYFDNSADNPNNPNDPPELVEWGEKTTDEMCLAFIDVVSARKFTPKGSEQTVAKVSTRK